MGYPEAIQPLECPACGAQVLVTTYMNFRAYVHDLPGRPERFDRPERATCPRCKTEITYYLVKPL